LLKDNLQEEGFAGRHIQHLNEEHGKTIVLITHETSTAEHAERIINLLDGEIESDKKVKKRLTPEDEFVK
jgi:ABC-type lipoprotein export system ATPase subunit